MIGRVLAQAIERTRPDGCETPQEKAALKRAGLWDTSMARPSDRIPALRVGSWDRGLAMHRALDTRCIYDSEAVARYATLKIGPSGGGIRSGHIRAILQTWDEDWRRFGGPVGGVPLDALVVALVAAGYDPPVTFKDVVNLPRKFGLSSASGGSIYDWPNIEIPV